MIRPLVAAALVAFAGAVTPVGAVAAPGDEWYDGPCTDADGVTVVVDFQELGGGVNTRCAPGPVTSGLDALDAAGIVWEGVQRTPGFVCRIAGLPGPDTEACVVTPPATAYWSYWIAPRGGEWCSSQLGAASRTPPPGTVEGWSFSVDHDLDDPPPPRTAPPERLPGVPPTPIPAGDCAGGTTTTTTAPATTAPPTTTPATTTPVTMTRPTTTPAVTTTPPTAAPTTTAVSPTTAPVTTSLDPLPVMSTIVVTTPIPDAATTTDDATDTTTAATTTTTTSTTTAATTTTIATSTTTAATTTTTAAPTSSTIASAVTTATVPIGSVDLGDDGRGDGGFGPATAAGIAAAAGLGGVAAVAARRRRAGS